MTKLENVSIDFLKISTKESKTFADLIRKIDYRGGGSYLKNLKRKLVECDIDYSHIREYINENYSKKDLKGAIFGHWTVISKVEDKGTHRMWLCKCECGNEKIVYQTHLTQGNTNSCKMINCPFVKSGEVHHQWNGIGEISGGKLYSIKNGAKKRGIGFNITKEYMWELFIKQNRKCALSGVNLTFGINIGLEENKEKVTASLDRIDNTKGYIEGNVWWVHRDINWMKNTFEVNYFFKLCDDISNHNKGQCDLGDLGITMQSALNDKKSEKIV